jgi:hypothetical protein
MSSAKHRRVVTAGGPSAAEHIRGRKKLRRNGSALGNTQSAELIRPDSSVVNEAIRIFAIGRNRAAFWVSRDCDGSAAGLFLSKAGAIRFAKRISGANGCGLMFMADGLELDGPTSIARAWHHIMPLKIAKLIARLKLEIQKFLIGPTRENVEQNLIERELYRNQYRYRSKSDDDLPIERDVRGNPRYQASG